jgi:hypothetical protein
LQGTQGVQIKGNSVIFNKAGVRRSANTIYVDLPDTSSGSTYTAGDGISIAGNVISNNIDTTSGGLKFDASSPKKVLINPLYGLEIVSNYLRIAQGKGVAFDENNKLKVALGQGLYFNGSNSVEVQLNGSTLTIGATGLSVTTPWTGTSEIFVAGSNGVGSKGDKLKFTNGTVTRSGNTVEVTINGSTALTVKDEGTTKTTTADSINFTGSGVAVTMSAGIPQVTISGSGSFDPTQDYININEYLALREVSRDTIASPPTGEIRIFNDIVFHTPAFKMWDGESYLISYSLISDYMANYLLHFDGGFSDSGTYGSTWTSSGGCATSGTVKKFGTESLYMDGADDYIYTSNVNDLNFGNGNFTIDFWFYAEDVTDVGLFSAETQNKGINIMIQGASKVSISYHNTSNTRFIESTGSTTITANVWHHLAVVRNGSSFKQYVDGVLDASDTGIDTIYTNDQTYRIGRLASGFYYTGNIDEFRVVKGSAVWTANFSVPTAHYAK